MPRSTSKLAIRRVIAFCIDYIFIAVYICVLIFVNVGLMQTSLEPQADLPSKIRGHAIAFSSLTLPVWLYLILLESRSRGATFGKRVMKLRVTNEDGERAGFGQIAVRNGIKLLPWELAHAAIWYVPDRPFLDPMPTLNLAICILANGLAIMFALTLFLGGGRTPYDRLSKTIVSP